MKNIAILGSSRADIFKEIVKTLKLKYADINITCLSDNINSDILKTATELNITKHYLPFEENTEHFASNNYDLVILTNYNKDLTASTIETGKFINIHPSLLPAFKGEDAIQRAFLAGVKVSGVTIYKMSSDIDKQQILAQYPVLIGFTTHFDEFEKEIYELEKKLYPPVILAILEDRVFDFQDLFQNNCTKTSKCGGCNKCQD